MAVYDYTLASGATRWMYIIDLPPTADGKRRQQKRKGFNSQAAALAAETQARAAYGSADLSADGSLAAELESWLAERELDVQETTVSNYRDLFRCYVIPFIGPRQLYTIDKRVLHDLYTTLLKRGSAKGGPLSATTVRIVHRVLMKALGDLGVTVEGVRQPRPVERETMGRKGAAVTEDPNQRLRAAMAATLRVTTGESEPDVSHLSDVEQLIAFLKAAPDGLTGRQLDALLPGGPRRRSAAFRAATQAQRITSTAELRPNRSGRRQRQIVYRPSLPST